MAREYRTLKTEVRFPYEVAYGATWTRFFEGLKDKKIYGTRCKECKRVLVPARSFCPRCFVTTDEWVEVKEEGTLVAWCYTNYRYFGMPIEPPFVTGLIRLDGTDVNFLHLIGGFDLSNFEEVSKTLRNGIKVKAVWSEERRGHILDIRYFEPV